jgi:chromate transport protein ChrA
MNGLATRTTIGSSADNLSAATGTGLANYSISYSNGSLQVTPATLSITGTTTLNSLYTSNAQTNAWLTPVGLLGSDTVTGMSGLATRTTVGSSTDSLSAAIGTGLANYTISYNNGSLQVTPAALAITGATTLNSVYTGYAQTNTWLTPVGLLGSDTVTGMSGLASRSNVGTSTDNLSAATGTGLANYSISYNNGSLQVTPTALAITGATTLNSLYTSNAQTNTWLTPVGLLGSDTVTGMSGLASRSNVGTSTDSLSAAIGTGLANYTISYNNGSLQVTPTALAIAGATTLNSLYTSNAQTNTWLTPVGLLGSDTVTGMNGLATRTTIGSSTDSLSAATGTGLANYSISYSNGSLQVTPASLTITANNQTRLYGGVNPTFTETITGFVNGENSSVVSGVPTATSTATSATDVGSVVITASNSGLSAANYNFNTLVDGILTIDSLPVPIVAPITTTETTQANVSTQLVSTMTVLPVPTPPITSSTPPPLKVAYSPSSDPTQGGSVTLGLNIIDGGIKLRSTGNNND